MRKRWAPWAVLAAGLVSAVPLAGVGRLLVPEPGDPGVNCGGIGFGEQPCGWDAVGLGLLFLGVPYLFTATLLLGLLELGGPRWTGIRFRLAVVLCLLPWLWVALVAISS